MDVRDILGFCCEFNEVVEISGGRKRLETAVFASMESDGYGMALDEREAGHP